MPKYSGTAILRVTIPFNSVEAESEGDAEKKMLDEAATIVDRRLGAEGDVDEAVEVEDLLEIGVEEEEEEDEDDFEDEEE